MKAILVLRNGHKMAITPEKLIYSDGAPMVETDAEVLAERLADGMVYVNANDVSVLYYTPDDDDALWE